MQAQNGGTPAPISGSVEIFAGYPYTYTSQAKVPGMLLQWSVKGGEIYGPATGDSVTIVFDTSKNYAVTVKHISAEFPHNLSEATSLLVRHEKMGGVISGPDIACANSYSTFAIAYDLAEHYEWEIMPKHAGSVTSGNGTGRIEVLWNHTEVPKNAAVRLWLSRNGYQFIYTKTFTVQGNPPLMIKSDSMVCAGTSFSIFHNAPPGTRIEADYGNGATEVIENSADSVIHYIYPADTSSVNRRYNLRIRFINALFCTNAMEVSRTVLVQPVPHMQVIPVFDSGTDSTHVFRQLSAQPVHGYQSIRSVSWHTPQSINHCSLDDADCLLQHISNEGEYWLTVTGINGCNSQSNKIQAVSSGHGFYAAEVQDTLVAPALFYKLICDSAGYRFTLTAHQRQQPGSNVYQYDFYLDNMLLQSSALFSYTHAGVIAPGDYNIRVVVHYLLSGKEHSAGQKKIMVLPPLPEAAFTFSPTYPCDKRPVFFTNQSRHYNSSHWHFGDATYSINRDAQKVYDHQSLGLFFTELTVANSAGCIAKTHQEVKVLENQLANDLSSLWPEPYEVCEGGKTVLQYITPHAVTAAEWYRNGKPYKTVEGIIHPLSDTVETTGIYHVKVSFHGCTNVSIPAAVKVAYMPDVMIRGSRVQQAGKPFILNGFAGTDLSYRWTRSDAADIAGVDARLQQTLPKGSYTYTLTITHPATGCTKTGSATVLVE